MIVPDGRTDPEKLRELLGNPEETHLDLKAKVNLADNEDKLKFVKDAVTMSNRPPGGYILIGVDDSGNPCMPVGTIPDRSRFDGSRIGALIRGYVEADVHVLVQVQEQAGNEIAVVYIQNRGLPVPFSKDGQYADANGKMQTVFRKGEIFVREGPENVPIRYAHWQDILSDFAKQHRDEGAAAAQTVLSQFVAAQASSSSGNAIDVPLLMEMDEPTFAGAIATLLESDDEVRLRQFMRALCGPIGSSDLEDFNHALNKWTVYCAQCLYFERSDLVDDAIEKLLGVYKKLDLDDDANRKRLAVVERLYVVGGLAVRLEAWDTITSLTLRPVPSETYGDDYVWSSWIRHGQTLASRANLTEDPRGGFIISAARELMVEHPAMRPDLADTQVPAEEITGSDVALNSLCEFDIAYCFVVAAMGTGHGSGYPSSAAFDEERAKPMAQLIVANPEVRTHLFPDADDTAIAEAIFRMYEIAIQQSAINYGGRWWDMPPSVRLWVEHHRPPQV
ncbi:MULTISPECIES: helix-turn-helix domain-containing protein [Mycolicibacterium]|uniref:ATP-binding protein n=2 Tax=Mycolicibacterium TaxID=1866885 RepID=A0A1X0JFP7_9MYCO|nr:MULTISPECIES: ATP-binding protein [Mycolicibacterium]AEV73437.1 putative transcriptional regulator with HTH domain [Mycolicibacterium rhodesiae NBB3]ORB61688.1 ATP-binding protein [Mycolicibacterium tusciae]